MMAGPHPVGAGRAGVRLAAAGVPEGRHRTGVRHDATALCGEAADFRRRGPGRGRPAVRLRYSVDCAEQGLCCGEFLYQLMTYSVSHSSTKRTIWLSVSLEYEETTHLRKSV